MSEHLKIYNAVRAVPPEAQKAIGGGRLKGMTDINPMWRIKTLTDQFGPCGFGWKYTITNKWIQPGPGDEVAAFVDIDLYIKMDGEWSAAIPGTGGSAFVAAEARGPYMSDECFKMALTDAISVACKALGMGADVYWQNDRTKYTAPPVDDKKPPSQPTTPKPNENAATGQETPQGGAEKPQVISPGRMVRLYTIAGKKGRTECQVNDTIKAKYHVVEPNMITVTQYNAAVKAYEDMPDAPKS